MAHENLNWTHQKMVIRDIRKLNKLYVISVAKFAINDFELPPLFIKDTIFEERIRSYFFKEISRLSREEILNLRWNMYITKGYYIKINDKFEVEKYFLDPEKWYVSYLEIDGPLGEFCSVYSNVKESYKEKS